MGHQIDNCEICMENIFLEQLANEPTRIRNEQTSNLLDLVIIFILWMRYLSYLTRVPYHVDVGCYLTIQTKLLYLLSGGSVLLASFLSSFAGFPLAAPSSLAFYIACSYQVFHLFLAHDVSEKLHLPVYHFT